MSQGVCRLLVLLLLLAGACSSAESESESTSSTSTASVGTTTTAPTTTTTFAPGIADAQAYLFEAMRIVESDALFAHNIDWDARREEAIVLASEATQVEQLHEFVLAMLLDLEDRHSWLLTASEVAMGEDASDTERAMQMPTSKLVEDRIGLITLPGFALPDPDDSPLYIDTAYQAMADLEAQNVCGWIIDLRLNYGGNWAPMFGAVVPLLTDQVHDESDPLHLGTHTNVHGEAARVVHYSGVVGFEEGEQTPILEPLLLNNPEAPVAVALGSLTESSGEMTATLFNGRPNTRFFGAPTTGIPAGSDLILLEDGAGINFAYSRFTDRQGTEHDPVSGHLQPDETSKGLQPLIDWLLTQPACSD